MIGLDARLQSYRAGGISEHIARLIAGLAATGRAKEVMVLRHAKPFLTEDYGPRGLAGHTLITPPHHRFENQLLPLELLPLGLDLLHSPDSIVPAWWRGRSVITVHDVAYLRRPELLTDDSLRYYGQIHRAVARAKRIIVVSDYTRRELLAMTEADDKRVRVIPNALHPRYSPANDTTADQASAACYGLAGPFILFVSTIEPRKNIGVLLRAFRQLLDSRASSSGSADPVRPLPKLALVGADGWHSDEVYGLARELGLASSGRPDRTEPASKSQGIGPAAQRSADPACFLGYLPYNDLVSLYRTAAVVAHPALDEGFGLTVLEAMACGAPAVVADAGSLPEVAGDAALGVPPDDPAAWAAALTRVLDDPALAGQLRAAGLARARDFTAERMAESTWNVYAEVLGLPRP